VKGLFFTAVLAAAFFALVGFAANRPVGGSANVLFVVNAGDGPRTIAAGLEQAGLIRSERLFLLTVWSRGSRGDFAAGTFELSPSMTTREIERTLSQGEPVSNERSITVLEGWTLDDIAAYLERENVAAADAFHAETGRSAAFARPGELPDWNSSFDFLRGRPESATLEGYLFPDTYRIYVGSDAKAVVRRLLQNFGAKLTPELRAEIGRSGRELHEIITMASVIEREVHGDEDRRLVSDIFWKRVGAGMGLQADSTVNYVTGRNKPAVSYKETQIDSPWNTYKYRGLPAGPIGNPGMSAILAALRPEPNPYWYFLTDRQGNVHYARTIDEHNANKAKYLR
jgi:UPF0755 protein